MAIANPQPLWLLALLPFLPGLYFVGRTLALRAGVDRALAADLAPALAVAAFISGVHTVAYLTGSLVLALVAVLVPLGLTGWGLWLVGREGGAGGSGAQTVTGSPWRWPVIAGLTLFIAPTALGWAFHDELFFTGHMSITAQLQNDIYPPNHLTFPAFELRYHYGFNTLCASLTALTRLPIDLVIDLVTLAAWAYTGSLLWRLGERLFKQPGAGLLTTLLVLLGGGLAFFCAPESAPLPYHLLGLCKIDGAIVNPPIVSYFFQHPWTLGLPLAVAAILLVLEGAPAFRHRLGAVLTLLFLALSLSQIVLFATVGASVAAAAWFRDGRLDWPRGAWVTGGALLALALATQLGGVFAPAPDNLGGDLLLHPGMADSAAGTIHWHMATFGVLLPMGLAGLFLMPRSRLLLGLLMGGSLLVINLVRHAHSWDIAKFATVTALALAIASVPVLLRFRRRGGNGLLVAGALLVPAIAAGLAFPLTFALRPEGIPTNLYHQAPQQLDSDDVAAVNWLRLNLLPGEIVYRRFPEVSGYAQQAGLPQPWVDNMVARHGYSPERIRRRMALLANWPEDVSPLLEEGIRYLVIGPEEQRLRSLAVRWCESGHAEVIKRFGPLLLLRLND